MTLNEYQDKARQTAIYPGYGRLEGLLYTSLGLGEVGEFQNKVKKILRDDHGRMRADIRESLKGELGDILWYVAMCASELGTDLETIAERNVNKLQSRQIRDKLKGSGDER